VPAAPALALPSLEHAIKPKHEKHVAAISCRMSKAYAMFDAATRSLRALSCARDLLV
jgi:hypothetical protein